MHHLLPLAATAVAITLLAPAAVAQAPAEPDTQALEYDRMSVVGDPASIRRTAGSAHVITEYELEKFDYTDIHRMLRSVPGVYLIEEEGLGLRPNIGLRGSGTDRSARITLLEDGILIAPAPYAAPAAYYFPTAMRMAGIELRKGSASIKHGPYTTGGALNMLSTPIPYARGGRIEFDAGSHATQNLHAHFGGSGDTLGFLIETVQQRTDGYKDLDGGGDTGYALSDYLVKLRWMPLANHSFELKLGATEQDGDETYLGLTAADFAATPFRRYAASQLDNIETSHRQYQLRHEWAIGPDSDLTTVFYNNDFSRAWYKLQSVGGEGLSRVLRNPGAFADEYAWLTGSDSPDDALVIRNNDRSYYSRGVQSVFGLRFGDAVTHEVEIGLRVHEDEEDRLQEQDAYRMAGGTMVLTDAGARGSQANRLSQADAVAVFIQDEIRAGAWTITPGIRHERIDGTRIDYATTDPMRAAGPTRVRSSSESVTIPGLGVNRELGNGLFAFASAHRGFTPPAPGSTSRAEESVNYEYGIRYGAGALYGEVIGFYNDYSNLVGTCTASTGGGCEIGDQFDGGEVSMSGVELALGYGVTAGTLRMPLNLSYTMTRARFDTAFDSGFGEWGSVQRGDELPYLPEHQLRIGAGIEAAAWQVNLGAAWVDEMRTTAGRGIPVRTDRTDSYLVLDLAAGWTVRDGLTLVGKVDNLLDDEHIVAWRPAGARPGKPRSVTVGVRYDF